MNPSLLSQTKETLLGVNPLGDDSSYNPETLAAKEPGKVSEAPTITAFTKSLAQDESTVLT